jgi:hypothetical protein
MAVEIFQEHQDSGSESLTRFDPSMPSKCIGWIFHGHLLRQAREYAKVVVGAAFM